MVPTPGPRPRPSGRPRGLSLSRNPLDLPAEPCKGLQKDQDPEPNFEDRMLSSKSDRPLRKPGLSRDKGFEVSRAAGGEIFNGSRHSGLIGIFKSVAHEKWLRRGCGSSECWQIDPDQSSARSKDQHHLKASPDHKAPGSRDQDHRVGSDCTGRHPRSSCRGAQSHEPVSQPGGTERPSGR